MIGTARSGCRGDAGNQLDLSDRSLSLVGAQLLVADDAEPVCSFCGKSQAQVKTLIAGPGVHICGECVEATSEIIGGDVDPAEE